MIWALITLAVIGWLGVVFLLWCICTIAGREEHDDAREENDGSDSEGEVI